MENLEGKVEKSITDWIPLVGLFTVAQGTKKEPSKNDLLYFRACLLYQTACVVASQYGMWKFLHHYISTYAS